MDILGEWVYCTSVQVLELCILVLWLLRVYPPVGLLGRGTAFSKFSNFNFGQRRTTYDRLVAVGLSL
jgi:hypothetical protein